MGRGRPKSKNQELNKTETLSFRVTKQERKTLDELSDMFDMPRGDFIRMMIFTLEINKTDSYNFKKALDNLKLQLEQAIEKINSIKTDAIDELIRAISAPDES